VLNKQGALKLEKQNASSSQERRGIYRIELPGDDPWTIDEWTDFPRAFEQCYCFLYVFDNDFKLRRPDLPDHVIRSLPYEGGFSYVNFFRGLRESLPSSAVPKLHAVHKASSGLMELLLNPTVATGVATSALAALKAGELLIQAAKRARKALDEYKRGGIAASAASMRELTKCKKELAALLGLKSVEALDKLTGGPELTVKLLLAYHRRLDKLVDEIKKGKIVLPLP